MQKKKKGRMIKIANGEDDKEKSHQNLQARK
jgi:hypothetical protein